MTVSVERQREVLDHGGFYIFDSFWQLMGYYASPLCRTHTPRSPDLKPAVFVLPSGHFEARVLKGTSLPITFRNSDGFVVAVLCDCDEDNWALRKTIDEQITERNES